MVVMIPSSDLSQEIFAIDTIKVLKPSLEHSREHVLRLLQVHGRPGLSELVC